MAYIKGTCKKMITHREGLKPYRCDSYDLEGFAKDTIIIKSDRLIKKKLTLLISKCYTTYITISKRDKDD